MNLALKDIRHGMFRFVLTCFGLGLLMTVVLAMIGIYNGLVADALAHIQVSLLNETSTLSDLARASTQKLFDSLRGAMPREQYQTILRHSSQAALAWQQARRTSATH